MIRVRLRDHTPPAVLAGTGGLDPGLYPSPGNEPSGGCLLKRGACPRANPFINAVLVKTSQAAIVKRLAEAVPRRSRPATLDALRSRLSTRPPVRGMKPSRSRVIAPPNSPRSSPSRGPGRDVREEVELRACSPTHTRKDLVDNLPRRRTRIAQGQWRRTFPETNPVAILVNFGRGAGNMIQIRTAGGYARRPGLGSPKGEIIHSACPIKGELPRGPVVLEYLSSPHARRARKCPRRHRAADRGLRLPDPPARRRPPIDVIVVTRLCTERAVIARGSPARTARPASWSLTA